MAALTIRPARPGDAAAIAAIWTHWIETSTITFTTLAKTADDVAALIADRPLFLVASDPHVMAGFATCAPFRVGPGYARTREHTILLAPRAARQGTGTRLLGALEQGARAAGHQSLVGGLSAENAPGLAFHAARGFVTAGRIVAAGQKWGRAIDLIFMQKMLHAPA